MNAQQIINELNAARSAEEIRNGREQAAAFLKTQDGESFEVQAVRRAKSDALTRYLDEVEMEQQETLRYLALNGKQYRLDEWLTPVEYARKYRLRSPNNVTNWMIRGVIQSEDFIEIPELNGLRLVRDKLYKDIPQRVE